MLAEKACSEKLCLEWEKDHGGTERREKNQDRNLRRSLSKKKINAEGRVVRQCAGGKNRRLLYLLDKGQRKGHAK